MKSSTTIPNNSSNFRFSWEISNSQYLVPNLDSILTQALQNTSQYLSQFRVDAEYTTKLKTTFGTNFHQEIANSIFDKLAQGDFSDITSIEIVSRNDINGANGAFSITTGKIYLAAEFIGQNANNVNAITAVLLEEVAHFVDAQINLTDTAGDEGEKFSALVRGVELSDAQTQQIQTEDDSAVITLNAQTIQIEQATVGANPAFDLIGLTRLRNDSRFAGIDGSGFTVAVLDTGLDASHTLISPNFRAFADFVDGGDTPPIITIASQSKDSGSHGTHVAGTVGARDENVGVAPDVGLIGLRAIGPWTAVRNSLQWVLKNRNQYNIIAVNMSLGELPSRFRKNNSEIESQGGIFTEINDIINRLENAGVTVVSAAGNDYFKKKDQGVAFPAISSTINVGAVWKDGVNSDIRWSEGAIDYTTGADRLISFSQRLDDPNNIYDTLFAPGAFINSTVPRGRIEESGGTSQASPHVAGAVALMQEAAVQFGGRVLSPAEIVEILRSTGDQIVDGDDEDNNVTNTNTNTNTNTFYRRLNIYNAISEIKRRFERIAPPPPEGGAGDPNGTITGAYLLQTALDGSPVDAILGSIGTDSGTTQVGDKDVDIFRFEVVVPGTVTIELGSHPNNANGFDTLLRLFNSSGTELVFDDDSGAGSFSRLEFDLNPGVYYAGVSGYNNRNYNPNVAGSGVAAATGNYSIQFSLGNTDLNGLLKNAVDISLGTDIDPFDFKNGSIGADYGKPVGVGDVDLFKVIIPDNGTLYIDIDTPFGTGYVDSYVRLFDEDGNQVLFDDDTQVVSNDDLSFDANEDTEFTDERFPGLVFEHPIDRTTLNGHTTDSFIAGGVERGAVYYIGVSDYANQNYNTQNLDNRSTAGTGGSYNLTVQFINNDRNGSITQAVSNVTLPVTGQPGNIGVDTDPQTGQSFQVDNLDVDFVKIRSATAGILEIDIDSYENTSFTNHVDTVISIFDAQGQLLAENDDTNDRDPLLQYQIQANTDYFVAVSGYGNSNFDPFMLGSGSPGDTGQYIFNSRLLSTNQVIGSLSNGAINYSLVQSQPITIGSPIFADIGSDNDFVIGATDIDIYRFVANSTGRVQIRTSTSEAFSADTFLRFFDANGNELAFNDNENSNTRGSFLEVQVTAGSQYYIGVNGYISQARNYNPLTGDGAAAGSQGNYTLILSSVNALQSKKSDFNKDGKTDILLNNPNQGWNTAWLMDGTNYAGYASVFGSAGYRPVATADFNKDGKTDLVVNNPTNNFNSVWFMDGGNYVSGVGLPTAAGWQIKGAADFNGDGNTDILLNNTTTNWNTVWFLGGANGASYTGFGNLPVANGWNITGVADFNGDGNSDILLNNPSQGWNSVWFLNGTTYSGYANLPSAPGWRSLGTGDFNGDGKPDIILNNLNSNWNTVWLMNGTNYAGFANLPTAPAGWQIAGMA